MGNNRGGEQKRAPIRSRSRKFHAQGIHSRNSMAIPAMSYESSQKPQEVSQLQNRKGLWSCGLVLHVSAPSLRVPGIACTVHNLPHIDVLWRQNQADHPCNWYRSLATATKSGFRVYALGSFAPRNSNPVGLTSTKPLRLYL